MEVLAVAQALEVTTADQQVHLDSLHLVRASPCIFISRSCATQSLHQVFEMCRAELPIQIKRKPGNEINTPTGRRRHRRHLL